MMVTFERDRGRQSALSLLKFIALCLSLSTAISAGSSNCSRGYFRQANVTNKTNESQCLPCPAGTYQPAESLSCIFCPRNSTSLPASTSVNNCTCNDGYKKLADGSCELCKMSSCSRGYFPVTTGNISICFAQTSCLPCVSGKYQQMNSRTCTACPLNSSSVPASISIDNCTCNAGYTKALDGNCTLCGSGTYKSSSGPGLCLPCPPGSTSVLQGTACACSPGFRIGSLSPTPYSAGANCDYPACHSSLVFTDYAGFFCNRQYRDNERLWWMIAPSLPYSGIQLTFLEFETELQSDFVTVYFCASAGCCGLSADAPPASCWARTPVAKSGRIRHNASAPADICGRRPLPEGLSNPIRSLSAAAVLKVVFTSDFSVARLGGFAAKWESIDPPCVACSTGSYKDMVGDAPCTQCLAGKYSAVAGATACVDCPRFSESRLDGSASCMCIEGCSSAVPPPSPVYKSCSELSRTSVWYNASSGHICYIFQDSYPLEQDLWWVIVSPHPNTAIYLAFGDNNPEGNWTFHTESVYDYVTVYECPDEACDPGTSRKLTRHSGPTPPDPVWSLTGFMRLEFRSDTSVGFTGFLAWWKVHPDIDGGQAERCGRCPPGTFKDVRGPSECILCVNGYYSDTKAATECSACSVNHTYTEQDQTDRCSCNVGYYFNDTADEGPCLACPAGTFKDVVSDNVGCTPCPKLTSSTEASAMCACFLGYNALPAANETELSLTFAPIDPYIVQYHLPIPRYCPPQQARWDEPAILTAPSALICRLDPLEREALRWIIKPALPNAGVQLFFTNFFDIPDVDGFVSVFSCKDESCQCYTSGRCDSLQNPTSGSAQPILVVSTTGIMLVEFCTNCSAIGNTLDVSVEPTSDSESVPKLEGSGFIAFYQSFVGDNCAACKPGSYSASPGPGACKLCRDGYFTDLEAASACESCPATYASISDEGSTSCRCAVGYSLNNKTKACDACPAGTYSASTGCAKCPRNAGSEAHAELCVCNAGYEWSVPLVSSEPVPEGTVCKFGCQSSACNGLQDRVLTFSSGVICRLDYGNNEDIGWVIQPSEPNSGMILTFTVLQVESTFDNVSIFTCKDLSCFQWNISYMLDLSSQNSTESPIVTNVFSAVDSWTATDNHQLPAPLITQAKVVKVFFESDPSNGDAGFSLHWEKQYGKNCTACLEGTYKAIQGTSSCIPCPAGTYSSSQNSTACTPCSPNFFSDVVQSTTELNCKQCPGGSISRAGTSRKADCACFPGDYLDLESDSCSSCPAGSYKSTTGTSPCLSCPDNSYSMPGSGEITNCQCNAGFSGNISSRESVCFSCPRDTYKNVPGPAACLLCSEGSYSNTGSTAVSDCICRAGFESISGKFSVEPPFSSACPTMGSMLSALSGTVCHLNYGISEHEWWTISPVQGGVVGVSPILLTFTAFDTELYLDHLDVYSCDEPGCFSPKLITSLSGTSLPTQIYTTAGTFKLVFFSDDSIQLTGWSAFWQTEGIGCNQCSPGSYKSIQGSSKCVLCEEGSYTARGEIASTGCHACPENSWSPKMSSGITTCMCNAGFFRVKESNCSMCSSGTYKPFLGNSNCFQCGKGTYWTGLGATVHAACLKCESNSNSLDFGSQKCECNAGFSGNQASCEPCREGKYKNISGSSSCLVCNAGFYSDARGSSFCKFCAAGKYSSNAGATSRATCLNCVQDSMSSVASTSYLNCLCNLGFYQSDENSCAVCPAGTYGDDINKSTCSSCSAGKYSSAVAAWYGSVCQACPEHSNSSAGSADVSNCTCNAGYVLGSSGSCEACAIGKYKPEPDSISCVECDAGKSTGRPAAASVLDCNSCDEGMYWDDFQCNNCPEGKFSAQVNAIFEESCQPCSLGTFNNIPGATSCLACGESEFASSTSLTQCSNCPPNSVSRGSTCECIFPFKGVISNLGQNCSSYFKDGIFWVLASAGTSCYRACQALNSSCDSSTSLDSTDKLLMIANRTSTRCDFVTSSNSHLAPHRSEASYKSLCYYPSTPASYSCFAQDPYFRRFCSCAQS